MKTTTTTSGRWIARIVRMAALVLAGAVLAGCAGIPGPNPRDPFEPFNREAQKFNDNVDALVLRPTATAYREGVPPIVRTGVSNFFGNLQDAWTFVNSVLQFRIRDAGESLARVQINTIAGLGGIMDVASDLNIEKHKEDFGQTLGRWGVPAGPYIVIPFLGPSTLRDTLALPVDTKGDLVWRMPHTDERTSLYVLRAVDRRSNLLRVGGLIDEAALDKYSFTRDAYLQRRRAEVFDYKRDNGDADDGKDGADSKSDGYEPKADETPEAAPAARQPAPGAAR
jgi:phospholipid-binding lipoprotein MlaA